MQHDLVKADDIYVSGIPHYDEYFRSVNFSKEEFFTKLGLPTDRKLVVYSPVGRGRPATLTGMSSTCCMN